jgi:hypothetical protein
MPGRQRKIVLHLCLKGVHRSWTGARVFNELFRRDHLDKEYHAEYAGVAPEAKRRVTQEQIDRAHSILAADGLVMKFLRGYERFDAKTVQLVIMETHETFRNSPHLRSVYKQVYAENGGFLWR